MRDAGAIAGPGNRKTRCVRFAERPWQRRTYEKAMKRIAPFALALLALPLAPVPVQAQPPVAYAASAAPLADGEVRKIDKSAGTITLKHGEIRNLDMAPMTMVFKASDPKLLDTVKVGDKVKFAATMVGQQLVVTRIESAK
jgi:Cu(I)/Ag(I) efflux system periplasmic protein CusF